MVTNYSFFRQKEATARTGTGKATEDDVSKTLSCQRGNYRPTGASRTWYVVTMVTMW